MRKTNWSPEISPLKFIDYLDEQRWWRFTFRYQTDQVSHRSFPNLSRQKMHDIVMFFFSSSKGNILATAAVEDNINQTQLHVIQYGVVLRLAHRQVPVPPSNFYCGFHVNFRWLTRIAQGKEKKTDACVPFDYLLREKKLAKKKRKGVMTLFCRAETTTGKLVKVVF